MELSRAMLVGDIILERGGAFDERFDSGEAGEWPEFGRAAPVGNDAMRTCLFRGALVPNGPAAERFVVF